MLAPPRGCLGGRRQFRESGKKLGVGLVGSNIVRAFLGGGVDLHFMGVCFTFGASQRLELRAGSIDRIRRDEKVIILGACAKSESTCGRKDRDWTVSVNGRDHGTCPVCGVQSISRHSSYRRILQDLPAQGTPVTVRARLTRWRCRNDRCERRILTERFPEFAAPLARRTARLAGIVRLFGHCTGGHPAERLMARLGMTVGCAAIMRYVKRSARTRPDSTVARVVGVDDWAWWTG